MSERFVICDHGEVEASLVPLRFLDRPGMCPRGVYETILLSSGIPRDWDQHWHRLSKSCEYLNASTERLKKLLTPETVGTLAIKQGLAKGNARLRVEVFSDEHRLESGEPITFLAAMWPVLSSGNEPLTVAIGKTRRQHGDPRYNHKMLGRNYIEEELDTAALRHCGDIIFLNNRDELCEAAYSNIWLVEPSRLITPPLTSPCLAGVTRSRIITAAMETGIAVEQHVPVPIEAVEDATGMFLTSSIRGLQPVAAIEGYQQFPQTTETDNIITLLANKLLSC